MSRIKWILPVVLLLSACGVEGTSLLISDQQESEIGAEVHQQVLAEYPLFNDATVTAWVNELGGTLAASSTVERDGVNYQFFVLDSDIVNAFAAPGGYIYLTRGLIVASENEAEVAGVLGHEIGHVAHRHGVAKLERAAFAGLIGDVILGDGSVADDVVTLATGFVLNTDYSQEQESDADTQGVQFTIASNINPFGLVDFFYKLQELAGDSAVPDWLSSHPAPLDRAAASEAQIEATNSGITRENSQYRWDITGDFDTVQQTLAY